MKTYKYLIDVPGYHPVELEPGKSVVIGDTTIKLTGVTKEPSIEKTGEGWVSINNGVKSYREICLLAKLEPPTHRVKIGQRIIALREQKQITQEKLSELTGLDRANISKIENGRCNVTIDILQKICDTLDASIEIK